MATSAPQGPTQTGRDDGTPILVTIAIILLLLPSVLFIGARLTLPGDGTQVVLELLPGMKEGLVVKPLVQTPLGLRAGDIVLTIDDRSVDSWLFDAVTGRWSPGQVGSQGILRYGVVRDGIVQEVGVPLSLFPLGHAIMERWSVYLAIVYAELVCVLVFVRRARLRAAQLTVITSSAFLANALVFNLGLQPSDLWRGWMVPLWLWPATGLWGYGLSSFLHFSLVFPQRQAVLVRHPALLSLIYLGPWMLIVAVVTPLWWSTSSYSIRFLQHFKGTAAASLIFLLSVILTWVQTYRTSASPIEKRQMKWVLWGILVGLVPFVVGSEIPTLLNLGVPVGAYFHLLGLFLLAIPTTLAIAILRFRLYDIDLIINRTLVYTPLTAILAGLFAVSVTLSEKLFVAITGHQSDAETIIATLVVVAAFTPVQDWLKAAVDKRFKEAPEVGERLGAFAAQVRTRLAAIDPQQLSRRFLEEAVASLAAKGGAVYLQDDGQLQLVHAVGEWQGEAKLSVPMEIEGKSFGRVVFQGRRTGAAYSEQDRAILRQVASVVALAMEQDKNASRLS